MAIFDKVGRISATLLDMVRTRLALAAIEIEEETKRILGYFVLALLALILAVIALLLVAATVIIVFWESYRIPAALGMIALFGGGAAIAVFKLKSGFANRPRLLAATLAELNKDYNAVKNGAPE